MDKLPGWVKIASYLAASIMTAAITAWTAASQSSSGKVGDNQFERVTITNCREINNLKGTLREGLAGFRTAETQEQINRLIAGLETTDCSKLVSP